MKKTFLVSTLLLSGVTFAASDTATLKYGLNFEQEGSPTNIATDAGSVSVHNSAYVNWVEDTMDGSSMAANVKTGYSEFSGDMGVTTDDGFSIVLNLKYTVSSNWKDIITFGIGDALYKLEWNANSGISGFISNGSGGVASGSVFELSGLSKNTWYSGAIIVTGSAYTLTLLDEEGTIFTATGTGAEGELTYLATGGRFDEHNDNDGVYVDNLGVYDAALSTENLQSLAGQNIANVQTISLNVPEPTTASLTLLALGALTLRRRRK